MTAQTAILLIDPYNDFLHPQGKLNGILADSLAQSNTIRHLQRLVVEARNVKIPVFYCLHQQTHAHSFEGWQMMNKSLRGLGAKKVFEEGSFGAKFYEGLEPDFEKGDVVISKHWNSSSFANTDLQYQLQQRGIRKLVIAGLIANTCVEATARYAYEQGYHLTMLTNATAGFSTQQKDAATGLIWPLFADRVITTEEWVDSVSTNGKM